jgi:hypothetical protein
LWNCEQKQLALHFVQPLTGKIMSCEQKYFFLFSRGRISDHVSADEGGLKTNFDLANKSNSLSVLFSSAGKILEVAKVNLKLIIFCSAAQRKIWEVEQLKWIAFGAPWLCSAAQRNSFEVTNKASN